MSLEFDLWPADAVRRYCEEVERVSGPAGILPANDAAGLRERLTTDYPDWSDAELTAFIDSVLKSTGVALGSAAVGAPPISLSPRTEGASRSERLSPAPTGTKIIGFGRPSHHHPPAAEQGSSKITEWVSPTGSHGNDPQDTSMSTQLPGGNPVLPETRGEG